MRRSTLIICLLLTVVPLSRVATIEFEERRANPATSEDWMKRDEVMSRTRVMVSPLPDIASLDLSKTPGDPQPLDPNVPLTCRHVSKANTGTTQKFYCQLPDNSIVKVKYGWTPEIRGEIAASRLLRALGFGADRVSLVRAVTCKGCNPAPYEVQGIMEYYYLAPLIDRLSSGLEHTFDWVSVERKMEKRSMELAGVKGWVFKELDRIDPAKGGATRAEVDALRLAAVFLAHWDNKPVNQRLACMDAGENDDTDPGAPCSHPLAILQDVGATFGPTKVKYQAWVAAPIWKDAATCRITMETMPYEGELFPPVNITEAGRLLFASRIRQLSEQQITQLFTGANFPDPETGDMPARDITPWVRAFLDKVKLIVDRPPCPSLP